MELIGFYLLCSLILSPFIWFLCQDWEGTKNNFLGPSRRRRRDKAERAARPTTVYRTPSRFWEYAAAAVAAPFIIVFYLAILGGLLFALVWVVKYFWSVV